MHSPHEGIQSYSFRIQQAYLEDGHTCVPPVVAHKYLARDAVNKVHVARQPIDGHVLNICGSKQRLDCVVEKLSMIYTDVQRNHLNRMTYVKAADWKIRS